MAETVIVLYLSHFWAKFDEILHAEIFLPTWKAYHFSSRSQRLQGQRPQGHKSHRPKNFEINFLSILFICEFITPNFEAHPYVPNITEPMEIANVQNLSHFLTSMTSRSPTLGSIAPKECKVLANILAKLSRHFELPYVRLGQMGNC